MYRFSPKWWKSNKATINPKSYDNKCFQYAVTVGLNHRTIVRNQQIISQIKPLNKHNWNEINFPSHKNDWKKLDENNKSIAFNISYVPYNTKKIGHAYISKYNSMCKNQVILLIIMIMKKEITLL